MKIASFDDHRIGVVKGESVYDVTDELGGALGDWPVMRVNRLAAQWDTLKEAVAAAAQRVSAKPLSSVHLLAANPAPRQLFAAPANYRKHIGEIGARSVSKGRSANEIGFFMKASGSVVGAGGKIELPHSDGRRFDHESELGVIIGHGGRNIARAQAFDHVFGYCNLIDVTMRIEPGVGEEERVMRKSFATFTPLGPWIVTKDEVANPQGLVNRLWVNGDLRQNANTSEMIVDIACLIEMISSVVELNPGDVIATGTPEGVGPIKPGDRIDIEVAGLGRLSLPVVRAATPEVRRWSVGP